MTDYGLTLALVVLQERLRGLPEVRREVAVEMLRTILKQDCEFDAYQNVLFGLNKLLKMPR